MGEVAEVGAAARRREETAPENAQFSTGPTSEEGKAISAMNALKHGMRSKLVVLPDEDEAEFEALRAALLEELAPGTRKERALVETMAVWIWKRERMHRLETEFWTRGMKPGPDGKVSATPMADMLCTHGKEFSSILRYMSQASRGVEKAEKELRELRLDRGKAEAAAAAAERRAQANSGSGAGEAAAVGNLGEAARPSRAEAAMALFREMSAQADAEMAAGSGGSGGAVAGVAPKATPAVVLPAPMAQPGRRNSQFIPGRR